jgi:predicted DNA-binding ribbon-helix-helix protein
VVATSFTAAALTGAALALEAQAIASAAARLRRKSVVVRMNISPGVSPFVNDDASLWFHVLQRGARLIRLRVKHEKNHRICIHGRQTSVRLEGEMSYLLRSIAAECGTTAIRLIEYISAVRNPERSLSSEIRVCVATYFARQVPQTGFPDPASRFSFRVVPVIRLSRTRVKTHRPRCLRSRA